MNAVVLSFRFLMPLFHSFISPSTVLSYLLSFLLLGFSSLPLQLLNCLPLHGLRTFSHIPPFPLLPSLFHCPFLPPLLHPLLSPFLPYSPHLLPSTRPFRSFLWTQVVGATSRQTCPLPSTRGCSTKPLLLCSCLTTQPSMALRSCSCHLSALWRSLTCSASESCDGRVMVV